MKSRFVVFALVVALAPTFVFAGSASGAVSKKTLNFSELPTQAANGVHINGVTFGFTIGGVASTDATYGGVGPGTTKYVSDPCLEGNASGQLTLTFDKPTKFLQFGLVMLALAPLSPGFTVNLFDGTGASPGSFPVNTKVYKGFVLSEARFTKTGLAIKKAQITFASADAPRFAFDDLIYKA